MRNLSCKTFKVIGETRPFGVTPDRRRDTSKFPLISGVRQSRWRNVRQIVAVNERQRLDWIGTQLSWIAIAVEV
jgi:hypothetical protein